MSGNVNRWGRRQAAGFTILELIVVIGIMVFLAVTLTLVLPFIMKQAALKKARVDMSRLALVLNFYKLEMGRYPITDNIDDVVANLTKPSEGWENASTRHLAGIKFSVTKWKDTGLELEPEEWKLADPWGRPYVYCHALRYSSGGTVVIDSTPMVYYCPGAYQLMSRGPNQFFIFQSRHTGLPDDCPVVPPAWVAWLQSKFSGSYDRQYWDSEGHEQQVSEPSRISHLRGLDRDDLANFGGL